MALLTASVAAAAASSAIVAAAIISSANASSSFAIAYWASLRDYSSPPASHSWVYYSSAYLIALITVSSTASRCYFARSTLFYANTNYYWN